MGRFWRSRAQRAAQVIADDAARVVREAEDEARRKRERQERYESELKRIRSEIARAREERKTFIVVQHRDPATHREFVYALVDVCNEGSAEPISFTHRVWGGQYSTKSQDECVILRLSPQA